MTDAAPNQPPLVILDATSMLFRGFYAAPSRKAADGSEVAGLMALTQILLKLLSRAKTRRFVVVFDPPGQNFRHALSPKYKAQRKPSPQPLVDQLARAAEVCRALGLMTWQVPGFEADDVLATLAKIGRAEGMPVWCVSPDKDLYQLVDDSPPPIAVWRMEKKQIVDAAAVEKMLGVPPDRAVTYFSLIGDSSDNISGVRGIGPKAAASIVKRFATLDEVYDNLVRMWSLPVRGAKTLADKLKANKEDAYLAESLVRLRDDIPLPLDGTLSDLASWRGPAPGSEALFVELGFPNLLDSARRLAP